MAINYMWIAGPEATRPAAGLLSRIFFATDTGRIFLDNGTSWVTTHLAFQGAYSAGVTYQKNDLVTSGGSLWRALQSVTNVTPVEGVNWTLLASKGDPGRGFNPRGAWATSTAYAVDDIVTHNGATYRVINAHTSSTAPPGANYELWAAAGQLNQSATETQIGGAEIATQTETDTGTDDARIVTPLKLANRPPRAASETQTGAAEIATQTETDTGTDDARIVTPLKLANRPPRAASETQIGAAEIATQTEVNAGTDDVRFVTPLKLRNDPALGAFKVSLSTAQAAVVNNTVTRINFNNELFDREGWYDNATNFRYTPLKAGYYLFIASAQIGPPVDQKRVALYLYKNGANEQELAMVHMSGTANGTVTGSTIVSANGTTDFFDIRIWHDFGVNTPTLNTAGTCIFNGYFIGNA